MSVAVVVPASSANLGPGFDAFGLALGLRDELRAEEIATGLEIIVAGEGADEVPRDASHVVVHAMEAAFAHLGERPTGLRLSCTNVIPHARGLGSSSAAIVAGLALAGELVGTFISAD
jgi:homoserine kinase